MWKVKKKKRIKQNCTIYIEKNNKTNVYIMNSCYKWYVKENHNKKICSMFTKKKKSTGNDIWKLIKIQSNKDYEKRKYSSIINDSWDFVSYKKYIKKNTLWLTL